MSWVFEGTYADERIAPPEQDMFEEATHQVVKRGLAALSEREGDILRLRFGLDTGEPMTLEKIGAKLKLTRERIRQIEQESFAKLSHNPALQEYVLP
jgi:RNA polymerase primary sigma factor